MNENNTEDVQSIFNAGEKMGALTEAVRTLQGRFGDFERHVQKRCTDCASIVSISSIKTEVGDHERRLRWVERKMYGAVAATGVIVYLIDKIVK